MDLAKFTALELAELIRNKTVRIEAVVKTVFDNIEKYDEDIHAFISIQKEKALKRAKELQKNIDSGEAAGALTGVPIAIKDNICVEGMRNTCASKILKDFVPHYSATAVEKLENAGAIIVGKTNMDEFGMGSTTKNSYFFATRNPLNTDYIAGGSSGGSAAAVAADMSFIALGSDTGGSIRQPAAYCGLVGIKPTYGTVSRYGLVAYASSLEQIGPMGKNVSDCVKMLEIIAGYDEKDSTTVKRNDLDFSRGLVENVEGMRVGIPKEYFTDDLQPDIRKCIEKAVDVLKKKGAIVSEFNIDYAQEAVMAYYVIACAEASSNLARYDGVKYGFRAEEYENLQDMYKNTRLQGFGKEVRKRIELGEYVLSSGFYDEYYLQALKVRRIIKEEFEKYFQKYDVILSSVNKVSPAKLNDNVDDIKIYMDDMYTVPANLCGLPVITVPFGMDDKGMPVGVQMMGKCFDEETIIRAAYTLEQTERKSL